jgi:hypothetical protein
MPPFKTKKQGNKMNKLTLVSINDNEFEVSLSLATMKAKDALLKINIEHLEEQSQFEKNNPKFAELKSKFMAISNEDDKSKLIETLGDINNSENAIEIQSKADELNLLQDKYTILKTKAIVKKSGLTDKQIDDIQSDWDSEFWQNQDLENLDSVLRFFRRVFRIG